MRVEYNSLYKIYPLLT